MCRGTGPSTCDAPGNFGGVCGTLPSHTCRNIRTMRDDCDYGMSGGGGGGGDSVGR
jgi:hypothetical protein